MKHEQVIYGSVPSKSNLYKIIKKRTADGKLVSSLAKSDAMSAFEKKFYLYCGAYRNKNIKGFFELYRQSADSSASLLQNLYSSKKPLEQGIPLAIAVSKTILGNDGAVRVHGGGFAGTIQAFVPLDKTDAYREKMNALFGEGSCYVLRIRPVGGVRII